MTETKPYDLIVIGTTPAGIASAVRAAREGLEVLLVTHTHYLGGMISNGIGVWDTIYEGRRAPIVDEFKDRVKAHYRTKYGQNSQQYNDYTTSLSFEPHVGQKVINDFVAAESSLSILKKYYPIAVERAEKLTSSRNRQSL